MINNKIIKINNKKLIKKICLFCDILNYKIKCYKIYENNYVLGFLDIFPNSNGHVLVIPKIHFDYYSITDDLYLSEVTKAGKLIVNKIYKILKPTGINYIINEKEEAFQKIFHFHMHIIPKYNKNEGYIFKTKINKNIIKNLKIIQSLLLIK